MFLFLLFACVGPGTAPDLFMAHSGEWTFDPDHSCDAINCRFDEIDEIVDVLIIHVVGVVVEQRGVFVDDVRQSDLEGRAADGQVQRRRAPQRHVTRRQPHERAPEDVGVDEDQEQRQNLF